MTMGASRKPTREQIAAAAGRTVPDLITPGLALVFCGINPSLYSGAVGHHFARPGNRFWPVLHAAGFTDRVLSTFEEHTLLESGFGITNLVDRATAAADELTPAELREGGRALEAKIERYAPRVVAFLGVTAFRTAFHRPTATVGRQAEPFAAAAVWVLPNPSGLNAHYQLPQLIEAFAELREYLGAGSAIEGQAP